MSCFANFTLTMQSEHPKPDEFANRSCHSETDHCGPSNKTVDWLFLLSSTAIVILYISHWQFSSQISELNWLQIASHSVFELMNSTWWAILIGIIMISILGRIPREFVMSALGNKPGIAGIVRATLAGVLLDLCSHGVLMVGSKLYERGASIGQVVAFLISSPWNSLSLTLILITLVGLPWTLGFILLSILIAVVTGLIFEELVERNVLPKNPQTFQVPEDWQFWAEARSQWSTAKINITFVLQMLTDGIVASRMIVRWLLFGICLASLLRAVVPVELFATFLGPTLVGLGITVVLATLIEICSEGSTPIAADILNRANAPGNSFAFLMGGVATDYTEVMILKETTRSWRIALFLPLICLPQVILLAWLINITYVTNL